jgi:hypothetical protein
VCEIPQLLTMYAHPVAFQLSQQCSLVLDLCLCLLRGRRGFRRLHLPRMLCSSSVCRLQSIQGTEHEAVLCDFVFCNRLQCPIPGKPTRSAGCMSCKPSTRL